MLRQLLAARGSGALLLQSLAAVSLRLKRVFFAACVAPSPAHVFFTCMCPFPSFVVWCYVSHVGFPCVGDLAGNFRVQQCCSNTMCASGISCHRKVRQGVERTTCRLDVIFCAWLALSGASAGGFVSSGSNVGLSTLAFSGVPVLSVCVSCFSRGALHAGVCRFPSAFVDLPGVI